MFYYYLLYIEYIYIYIYYIYSMYYTILVIMPCGVAGEDESILKKVI